MPTRRSKAKSSGDDSVPERAKKLIAENKRTKGKFLSLGRCGLTRVPAEVGELVWLESLSLADNYSEWDGQEWRYEHTEETGQTNSGLRDLTPLAGLSALQALNVSDTQVSDLTPLAGLSALADAECLGHAGQRPRAADGPVGLADAGCLEHAGQRPCAAGGPVGSADAECLGHARSAT